MTAYPRPPWVDAGAFVRSLLPMVIMWSVWMVLATAGGYPGAVCVTPMAWLTALWSGTQYAVRTAGQPTRAPLLAPALLGAALGLFLGVTFFAVNLFALARGLDADELGRTVAFSLGVLVVGVPICAGLSSLTAWLTRQRYARHHGM